VMISVVSSAYVYTVEAGTVLMMSLMYKRKNVVDSVLPCGIPCVMVRDRDFACCVCVVWVRLLKYDLKKAVVFGVKLKSCCSLCSNLS
jgi:hypothetical protein